MFRYLNMLIWPLMGAGFMVNMIQRGAVSLGRIDEVLNTVPSIKDLSQKDLSRRHGGHGEHGKNKFLNSPCPPCPPSCPQDSRLREMNFDNNIAIEIKDLCFSYGERTVLTDINLSIVQGEWLGVMGKTGSGKSTLIKILTRTLDPPPDTVMVFGHDVQKWTLADLRGLFAVSPQDSYLFSDSIQNNIGYGLDSPDEALLRRAADDAALERDIAGFAEGKDTLIGERGLTLSGGQKQRVAIARALVMDSEFLILDDSLSAVDAETERNILDALLARRKGRTTIIISHRVSTLRYAHKVLVLDQGKQIEYGSPAELVNAGGFYSRMAALQRLDSG
jgi:ATP-binding cassette subfamily B protein